MVSAPGTSANSGTAITSSACPAVRPTPQAQGQQRSGSSVAPGAAPANCPRRPPARAARSDRPAQVRPQKARPQQAKTARARCPLSPSAAGDVGCLGHASRLRFSSARRAWPHDDITPSTGRLPAAGTGALLGADRDAGDGLIPGKTSACRSLALPWTSRAMVNCSTGAAVVLTVIWAARRPAFIVIAVRAPLL